MKRHNRTRVSHILGKLIASITTTKGLIIIRAPSNTTRCITSIVSGRPVRNILNAVTKSSAIVIVYAGSSATISHSS